MVVGVLALQGAFREHIIMLSNIGVITKELRQLSDCENIDALVIPGGESTTMGKLMSEGGMLPLLKKRIENGMPVYGSCAGLILLCKEIEQFNQPSLAVLDATVRRNAFGRQVDSFEADIICKAVGEKPFPAVFIRAPFLTKVSSNVEVLATVNNQPVAVKQGNILATSFHPELTKDERIHRYFLSFT